MIFVSRFKRLRLTIEPSETYIEHGRTNSVKGKHVQFENNQYETKDQSIIAWLKACPTFGVDFYIMKEDPVDKLAKVKRQIVDDDRNI